MKMKTTKQILSLAVIVSTLFSCSQGMKEFKTLKSGLQYKIVDDKKGDKKAVEGSMISMTITTTIRDSVLFDSQKMNGGKPIETPVNAPSGVGDIMEAFPLLSEGDSVILQIPIDSMTHGGPLPPYAKSGDMLAFHVRLISVSTKAEFEKKKADETAKQVEADAKTVADYVAKNAATATKTPSGMYYMVTQAGSGPNAHAGQKITMNYTGTLLDGTPFDSNIDPKFSHVQPFEFTLGQGMVIKGWDEGVALLSKGAKAKFIIPSTLAYGERAMPGSPSNPKGIPANSSLVFEVEVKNIEDVKAPAPQEQSMQAAPENK